MKTRRLARLGFGVSIITCLPGLDTGEGRKNRIYRCSTACLVIVSISLENTSELSNLPGYQ